MTCRDYGIENERCRCCEDPVSSFEKEVVR